ncbi:hypothetical protein DVH05_003457 [Phytophthora capsici]|nr:hypothetical protein DVH05_003457 [Phytophthora capsici]
MDSATASEDTGSYKQNAEQVIADLAVNENDGKEEKAEHVHDDTAGPVPPKVKPFNPRTRVGRPRKNRVLETTQRKQSRKEYNQGCKLRGALRGDDVVEVAEFIRSCEPPLGDLASFLKTFEVRFHKHDPKKLSIAWRVPEPAIAPYRLPEDIIREGLYLIECKRPCHELIDLCTPVDATAECWVLTIEGVGEFTHRQLLAMQYVWNLVHDSDNGKRCYTWLMNVADDQIASDDTAALAKRMLDAWPLEILPGFGVGFDISWVHLYAARSGVWYNDNLITAFGKTMKKKYGNNTTIFLPAMKTPVPRAMKKGMRIPATTLSEVSAADGVLFLPLNINATHWTCIVVDKPTLTVYCYDSMDKRANHNLLAEVADELVKKSLTQSYSITPVHSPLQKDGNNCGLFVCIFFWRRFWKEAGSDYTETGLLRRRWDVLRLIVEFSDESKEKETEAS